MRKENRPVAQNQNITAFPTSKKERKRLLRRSRDLRLRAVSALRALTGWMLMIAVLGFLAINYRLFTPSAIGRVVSYAQLGLTAAPGDLSVIEYASGSASDARLFGGGLALADSDTLYVAKPGGLNQLTLQLSYASIALDTAGDYILAYDRGGKGLTVANALSPLYQTELSGTILTASIADNGTFAVVTDEAGYKSAVTVCNAAGEQMYKWFSSEYYVQSAALSPSGNRLTALGFHMNGTQLESRVLFFELDQESIAAEASLGGALGLEVRFLSENTVCAVTDEGVFLVSRAGKLVESQTYAADDLLGFSFDKSAVAIATRSYTRSARSEVHVLSEGGKSTGPLLLTEELQSLSLSGGRLGVLTSAGFHLYDSALSPLWSSTAASGGRRLLLDENGTAFVLFSKEARLLTQTNSEEPSHATHIDPGGAAGAPDTGDAGQAPLPK